VWKEEQDQAQDLPLLALVEKLGQTQKVSLSDLAWLDLVEKLDQVLDLVLLALEAPPKHWREE
jgi:hypothetical protein